MLIGCLAMTAAGMADERPLSPLSYRDVRLNGGFWGARQETTFHKTLPAVFRQCEQTGRISNFDKAAGKEEGKHEGYFFNDSDVYKTIEGAAYALALAGDEKLDQYVDELIAKIAAAQEPDGYLNTYYTLVEPERKWTDLANKHELYCAGHLIEAGIAHFEATGKRNLLDVAVRFADLIESRYGPGKRADVPGHEEIELALIRLHHLTGEARYLNLARFFFEQRGRTDGRKLYGEYCQDHCPLAEHSEIVGHAVRAMYLYSGLCDLLMLQPDAAYRQVLDRVWDDVVTRKMYVTGGIGPSARNEGFTLPYDLPNESAYAETCAAIGMVYWNQRMFQLTGEARYIDVLERELYNGVVAGVSLDGERFFYVNPLAGRGGVERQPWFECACCPPNLVRLFSSLGGYFYAQRDDELYVNLYGASTARATIGGRTVTIRQTTDFPWDSDVKLDIEVPDDGGELEFTLNLRIPDWSDAPRLRLNGAIAELPPLSNGYLAIARNWAGASTIELALPMPIRRIECDPRVAADRGRVALQRGPLVYCLEGVDNNGAVRGLALPREAELRAEPRGDLLGGVTVVTGKTLAVEPVEWGKGLYAPARPVQRVDFVAVPYYAWCNRGPGEMVVWLPESPTLVELPPIAGLKPSASHCYRRDSVAALYDRQEPANSSDPGVPRFSWWDHRGTREWVQYDFEQPRLVSGVEVYWYDDHSGCRPPQEWSLQYRMGDEWRAVTGASPYGTAADRYNRVRFDPVTTDGLRIEAQLQPSASAGILEWRVQ